MVPRPHYTSLPLSARGDRQINDFGVQGVGKDSPVRGCVVSGEGSAADDLR